MVTKAEWERQKQRYYDLINSSLFDKEQKKELRLLWLGQLDDWRTAIFEQERRVKNSEQIRQTIRPTIIALTALSVALLAVNPLLVLLPTVLIAFLESWQGKLEQRSSADLQSIKQKANAYETDGKRLLQQTHDYEGLAHKQALKLFWYRLDTIRNNEPGYFMTLVTHEDFPPSRLRTDYSSAQTDIGDDTHQSGQTDVN
jgi:hypothetical protein